MPRPDLAHLNDAPRRGIPRGTWSIIWMTCICSPATRCTGTTGGASRTFSRRADAPYYWY